MLGLPRIARNVIDKCSLFGSSSLFDDACGNCTSAISNKAENLAIGLKVGGSVTEEATCLVAVVVSVLAAKMNNNSVGIDDFNRCLPALSNPGEIHIIFGQFSLSLSLSPLITLLLCFSAEPVNYIEVKSK